jgi:hypothetical protein
MNIPNDFSSPGFSIQTAYYLVNACSVSYLDQFGDWAVTLALGERAAMFQLGELHGFVADMEDATLLAFRGTDSIATWLVDGRALQIADPAYSGRVHRGFANALRAIWPDLKQQMPPPTAGRPVWVTGHSLGAALATLAAVRLLNEGYDVRATYTYGSPRVGNLDFYNGYKPVNYRFVNNNDLVPHVPPEFMLAAIPLEDRELFGNPAQGLLHFAYKHVGTLKYMDRHGKLGEGMSDWDQKKEFLAASLMRGQGLFEPAAVADHHIWNYVKAVGSNLPGGAPPAPMVAVAAALS